MRRHLRLRSSPAARPLSFAVVVTAALAAAAAKLRGSHQAWSWLSPLGNAASWASPCTSWGSRPMPLRYCISLAKPWLWRTSSAAWRARRCGGRFHTSRSMALPLRLVEGGEQLAESGELLVNQTGLPSDDEAAQAFEVRLPERQDLPILADFLMDSFAFVMAPSLLSEETWGPVAQLWNLIYLGFQRQVLLMSLEQSFRRTLRAPALSRPVGRAFEGHAMGLMVVRRDRPAGPPVAFCELMLLPADGRKPEDGAEIRSMMIYEPVDPNALPYITNVAVVPGLRRRGLGVALMSFAERVIAEVWGDTRVYLHADLTDDKATIGFYSKAGYVPVENATATEGLLYMYRDLVTPSSRVLNDG